MPNYSPGHLTLHSSWNEQTFVSHGTHGSPLEINAEGGKDHTRVDEVLCMPGGDGVYVLDLDADHEDGQYDIRHGRFF